MKVTLIGLGNMGAAVAGVLVTAPGISLTVWNRTAAKIRDFSRTHDTGTAETVTAAVEAGEAAIVCVRDCATALEILSGPGVSKALHGKPLIQLSNGPVRDVVRLTEWAERTRVLYLDGSIMGSVHDIGERHCAVAVCGPEVLWTHWTGLIRTFAPRSFYAGADRARGKAMNAAVAGLLAIDLAGFIHSAAVAEACGIAPGEFLETCDNMADAVREQWKRTAQNWFTGNSDTRLNGTASVAMWEHEIGHLLENAVDKGVPAGFLGAAHEVFESAAASGRESKDAAVLLELLRPGHSTA
jgi:3-hydroxyisobutyrate dehydrogenase-like beta-hydroxyacid dehydrogenase